MQELNRLQAIVTVCVVGIIVSFGGAIYTAVKEHKVEQARVIPESKLPVPATAQ